MARVLGQWLDALGSQTTVGAWLLFITITYRAAINPWRRGFPMTCSDRPSPEFSHYVFGSLIEHLEREISSPIAFVVADQYGNAGGRFHQHALVSGRGLDRYPRRKVGKWLRTNAGFNRVLPFKRGAAYYLANYIGRNLEQAEWTLEMGGTQSVHPHQQKAGGIEVARSANLPSDCFHHTLRKHGGMST